MNPNSIHTLADLITKLLSNEASPDTRATFALMLVRIANDITRNLHGGLRYTGWERRVSSPFVTEVGRSYVIVTIDYSPEHRVAVMKPEIKWDIQEFMKGRHYNQPSYPHRVFPADTVDEAMKNAELYRKDCDEDLLAWLEEHNIKGDGSGVMA